MPYIEYLNRVEAILSIVFQIIAFGSMSHLLYKFHRRQLKVKKLATTILIYLITHVIGFIVSVPSIIYEVFFLLQVLPKPTPLQIFWFDVALVVYFFVTPLPIFFLAIDRSFALKFPISHSQWIQRWLSRSAVVIILLWTVVEFGLLMLELPIDEIATKDCNFFSCVIIKYRAVAQTNIKLAMNVINLVCSFYFLYALRMGTSGNLKNRIVKVTIITEMVLNVAPSLFSLFMKKVLGIPPGNFLGQYLSFLVTVDIAICGVFYNRLLPNRKNVQQQTRSVTVTSHK